MDALTPLELAYIVFILIASFAVRGSAGFGGLNGPLLMVVMPPKVIVPALVLLGILSSAAVVARDHRHIEWHAVRQTLPYGVGGTIVGLWLFDSLDAKFIEKGLGFFIFVYGLYALWKIARPPKPLRISRGALAGIVGASSGLIGAMFGALVGVFMAVFLDALNLEKRIFRATMAATLVLLGIARAVGYFAVGAVTSEVWITFAIALPLMGIGVFLGERLHGRLNQKGFNRLTAVLFVVIGGFLFLR